MKQVVTSVWAGAVGRSDDLGNAQQTHSRNWFATSHHANTRRLLETRDEQRDDGVACVGLLG
jgi:hypothetical protein